MASIAISNLQFVGADLFLDYESFLNDLTDEDMNVFNGGIGTIKPILTGDTFILSVVLSPQLPPFIAC
ncbi:MAG: hypothetical protein KME55_35180 [Nostoc indistinguendum CM1-VF10]|jgi:hypothetical protein|nr:hypothetical protein [Nostoc indistinguendum CM1-VF10]